MKMSRGRLIMILSLFAWCAYVEAGRQTRPVDCEKYVYHPHCRGIQAKKRVYPAEIKIDNTEQPCVCSPSSSSSSSSSSPGTKDSNNRRTTFSNSKLLDAMLNGLDMNTIYEAYAASSDRHRNYNDITRERNSQRRRQPIDNTIDINDLDLLDY